MKRPVRQPEAMNTALFNFSQNGGKLLRVMLITTTCKASEQREEVKSVLLTLPALLGLGDDELL
jgi:geranylgeranyl pyrophosphate synthase